MSAAPPTFTIGASPVRPTRFQPVDSADPRNIFSRPTYAGPELRPTSVRPACDAGLDMPSRVGSTLRYRDGRITDLAGNPITEDL